MNEISLLDGHGFLVTFVDRPPHPGERGWYGEVDAELDTIVASCLYEGWCFSDSDGFPLDVAGYGWSTSTDCNDPKEFEWVRSTGRRAVTVVTEPEPNASLN